MRAFISLKYVLDWLSPFHGGDQWAEWGQFQGWWRRAASSCAGWRASSRGSSVYGEHLPWGSSGATVGAHYLLIHLLQKSSGRHAHAKMQTSALILKWEQWINWIKSVRKSCTLFTILRSLTTRVPPFLSPPTVLITVALGFSLIFFSILNKSKL